MDSSTTVTKPREIDRTVNDHGPADIPTRRQIAERLGCHPDSVTRLLPKGLGAAVLRWGGRGKEMTFSAYLVDRWNHARNCRRWNGTPCFTCRTVLEDCEYVAEHLAAKQHGHGGCDECAATWLVIGCVAS